MKRTITHRGMLAICLAAALVLSWSLVGKADAAAQLGQISSVSVLDPSPCEDDSSYVQAGTATISYAVPEPGGVITRWSHRASQLGGSGRLQVWRFVSGTNFNLVARSALIDFTPTTVNTPSSRIPVSGGDRIGFRSDNDAACVYDGSTGDLVRGDEFSNDPFPGEGANMLDSLSNSLLNVSARLEPDADADGFGDETQDDCPTDPSTQGACPSDDGSPPPDDGTPPPDDDTPPPGDGVLPSNEFSFGKVKKNKRKGTAKLPVSVALPPGELELARTKKVKGATERVDATATAKLPIRPRRKAKEKLNETGKAKVTAEVTYTSDAGGTPNTRSKKLKLKKR